MMKEFFRKVRSSFGFNLGSRGQEQYRGLRGEVFWTMTDVRSGQEQKGHIKNVVTRDASVLLARLMKGTGTPTVHISEPNFGVFALAVGTGDPNWDPLSPPPATVTQRCLWNELGRKTIQSTQYIDGDGVVSGVPTDVVDFITTFSESEAVGPLTEMGLLGGDISTNMSVVNPVLPPNGPYDPSFNLVGKDTLVNYITFPVISKPATSTLQWVWRLHF
jgi:hypothetical protein